MRQVHLASPGRDPPACFGLGRVGRSCQEACSRVYAGRLCTLYPQFVNDRERSQARARSPRARVDRGAPRGRFLAEFELVLSRQRRIASVEALLAGLLRSLQLVHQTTDSALPSVACGTLAGAEVVRLLSPLGVIRAAARTGRRRSRSRRRAMKPTLPAVSSVDPANRLWRQSLQPIAWRRNSDVRLAMIGGGPASLSVAETDRLMTLGADGPSRIVVTLAPDRVSPVLARRSPRAEQHPAPAAGRSDRTLARQQADGRSPLR